jgi:hypothetical protein
MGGAGVIDRFLGIFTTYIDSGFGLLGGEVAFLATTLAAVDITLAAIFWSWAADEDIIARLARKTLFVGVFAWLIGNWNNLARIVFESFAGLGLKASGTGMSTADLLSPGRVAQVGIDAGRPFLDSISALMGYVSFFENFVQIVLLLFAWIVVLLAFFVLAIQLFVTLIEFKLTTLSGAPGFGGCIDGCNEPAEPAGAVGRGRYLHAERPGPQTRLHRRKCRSPHHKPGSCRGAGVFLRGAGGQYNSGVADYRYPLGPARTDHSAGHRERLRQPYGTFPSHSAGSAADRHLRQPGRIRSVTGAAGLDSPDHAERTLDRAGAATRC